MTAVSGTLLTITYVLVDDWFQHSSLRLLTGKRGAKTVFGDSEVIILPVTMDYLPFPGEIQFLGFVRANYLALFPESLGQSQFNRWACGLRLLVGELRKHWALLLGVTFHARFLLGAQPVPVVGYKRSKRRSDFAGSATYEVVSVACNSDIYGGKGSPGEIWQQEQHDSRDNRIWTPGRINQKVQIPEGFDRWLNSIRGRIEGAFNEVQNTGRKTVNGSSTHVIAKMASHALRLVLRHFHGIDVLTLTAVLG